MHHVPCRSCNGSGYMIARRPRARDGKIVATVHNCRKCDGVGRHHVCAIPGCRHYGRVILWAQ